MSAFLYKTICARLLQTDFTKRLNMCCLCLEVVGDDDFAVDDEIIVNLRTGRPVLKRIHDLLKSLMGENFSEIMYVLKSVCKQCMVSALVCYKFIQQCKFNSDILTEAVENLEKSFDEIPDHAYTCQTLYVAINPENMYKTSQVKRFYDKKSPMTLRQVLSRFKMIANKQPVASADCSKPAIDTMEILYDPNKPHEFKCKVCEQVFNSNTSLRIHFFRKHHVSKDITCSKSFFFVKDESEKNTENLQNKAAKDERENTDNLQNRVAKSAITQLDKRDPLECPTTQDSEHSEDCGEFLTNESKPVHPILSKIRRNLKHVEIFTCDNCKSTFKSLEMYTRHQNKKTKCRTRESGTFYCDYCKRCFNYKNLLIRHIREKHISSKKICPKCGGNCRPSKCRKIVTNETNFVCPTCGKVFKTENYLKYHVQLHSDDTPYSCDECGLAFKTSLLCSEHIRRKHYPPTYICDICKTGFYESNTLKRHKERHFDQNSKLYVLKDVRPQGKRNYPCKYCKIVFEFCSQRRKHVREVHKPPSQKCDICQRKFQWLRDVRRHMQLHYNVNSKYYIKVVKADSTEKTL